MSDRDTPLLRRSSRLATIIPASYWTSLGYTGDGATFIENLQRDMQSPRRTEDGSQSISLIPRHAAAEDIAQGYVPHHDLLLPHWRNFGQFLKDNREDGRVEEVNIIGVQVPPASFLARNVLPGFHSLKSLDLSWNFLEKSFVRDLSDFILGNSTLVRLNLADDDLFDLDNSKYFAHAIDNHPSLKKLTLVKCGIEDVDVFETILSGCEWLDSISFFEEGFELPALAAMTNFIRDDNPTEKIRWGGTPDGCMEFSVLQARLLSRALSLNTNLRLLDLKKNDIGIEARRELLDAFFDTTDIYMLVSSNHSCFPIYFGEDCSNASNLEQEIVLINVDKDMSKGEKARMKVHVALSYLGLFDEPYFESFPRLLVPRLLELMQKKTPKCVLEGNAYPSHPLAKLFFCLAKWWTPMICRQSESQRRRKRKHLSLRSLGPPLDDGQSIR